MKFLTHNFGWKLVSLIAAFFIWMNVANEPRLATVVSVPVEYSNFPENLDISSNIVENIDVEARGPSGQLRSLGDSHLAAIIDFSSVRVPGERTFTLTPAQLNLPLGIELVRTIPAQLRFRFEARATRAVKVSVPFSGNLPAGLSIAGMDIEPPQLQISGPQSHVLASKSLVSDPFDLSRVNGDTVETLAVYAPEPEVRIVQRPQVTVKIRVQHAQ